MVRQKLCNQIGDHDFVLKVIAKISSLAKYHQSCTAQGSFIMDLRKFHDAKTIIKDSMNNVVISQEPVISGTTKGLPSNKYDK